MAQWPPRKLIPTHNITYFYHFFEASVKLETNYFVSRKYHWHCHLRPFCSGLKVLIIIIMLSAHTSLISYLWLRHVYLRHILLRKICLGLNFTEIAPRGSIGNNSALFQIMAWCLFGAKALPRLMMTQLLDVIMCQTVTRPQLSNPLRKTRRDCCSYDGKAKCRLNLAYKGTSAPDQLASHS